MEQFELDLIAKHRGENEELNSLWEDHLRYEQELEKIENRPYRTPSDDLEIKELKKKKLAGKTKIQKLLDQYKTQEA